MKQTVKNSRIAGYLEKIYRELNKDFFGGELEECFITIQNTPHAYGHVTCSKVWKKTDDSISRYELNIGAGTLYRPIEQTVATMLHEMVHIYNLMHDIQDCSRGGTYHNKRFREKAESVGLIIEYDKRIGWSITSPSEKLIDYVIEHGWEDIQFSRDNPLVFRGGGSSSGGSSIGGDDETPKKTSSTRKYFCPKCGMSVRATKDVRIKCADCDEMMIKAD